MHGRCEKEGVGEIEDVANELRVTVRLLVPVIEAVPTRLLVPVDEAVPVRLLVPVIEAVPI